jgi:hypothetical protein
MDFGQLLVADSQTVEIMESDMSTFDYPLILSESAAMFSATLGENRFITAIARFLSVCFGVVSAICKNHLRLSQGATAYATDGWNRVDEQQQLCAVMAICTDHDDRKRHPACVGRHMVLGARSRTVYGVRPSFWLAPIARAEDESTATRDKLIWPAARNSPSSTSRNRSHMPASCQSRKPRQQATPERNPFRRAYCANAALYATQTQCRSMLRDRVPTCDQGTSRDELSAGAVTVRVVAIIRRQ